MHVLGLPPAFVLSQDQTLKFEISIRHNPGGKTPGGRCVITSLTSPDISVASPLPEGTTHNMGVGKRSTARVSFAQSLDLTKISNGIRARQDSAVCVSLSFKTTLSKSRGPTATGRNPDLQWKQMPPSESNATKTAFRSLPGASPALQSDKVCADTKKPQAMRFARATEA